MTKLHSILALVFCGIVNFSLIWHMSQAMIVADMFGTTAAQSYLQGLIPLYIAVPLAGLVFWLARVDRSLEKQ